MCVILHFSYINSPDSGFARRRDKYHLSTNPKGAVC